MIQIGVPKEIKNREGRVGLTPNCVKEYKRVLGEDIKILIEKDAGLLSGFSNQEYTSAGAKITTSVKEVWKSDMVIKIKEPIESEFEYLDNQVLFTYIHASSPANKELRKQIKTKKVICVPYEEIKLKNKRPCLEPMSAIAGKLAIQKGAQFLESASGGNGILVGSLPGVQKPNVLILGGGTVGRNAAEAAVRLGANVTILDINLSVLNKLNKYFDNKVQTLYSNEANLLSSLSSADLVVGAILVPGGPPKVIKKEHLALMRPNSLVVDVAIDEGGCTETSKVTTHDDPVYTIHGIRHYCVANMPALVARTATQALTTVTLPYGLKIAKSIKDFGKEVALTSDGIYTYKG